MTAAQIHTAAVTTTVSSAIITIPITPTTAGSTLLLLFQIGDNDEPVSTIVSTGTTWVNVESGTDSSTWMGTGTTAATASVVVTLAGADRHNVVEVNEWTGLGSFEGNATIKNTTTGTSFTSNSYTTTHANDVVIGWVSGFPLSFSGTTTVTPSGAWTLNATTQTAGENFLRSGYQVVSATAAFTFSTTTSQSSDVFLHVVAFQQAGGTNIDVTAAAAIARAVSSTATVEITANPVLSAKAAIARAVSSLATVEAGSVVNITLSAQAAIARAVSSLANVQINNAPPIPSAGASIAQRILAGIYDDFENWSNPERNGTWTDPEFN